MLRMLVLVGIIAVFVQRADDAKAYDLIGVGTWSCEAWQEARKTKHSESTEQWALGFLSGAAFISKDRTDHSRGLPPQAVGDWLDRYCRAHPNETIAHGTESFTVIQETTGRWSDTLLALSANRSAIWTHWATRDRQPNEFRVECFGDSKTFLREYSPVTTVEFYTGPASPPLGPFAVG
jgi:hypothetical protein